MSASSNYIESVAIDQLQQRWGHNGSNGHERQLLPDVLMRHDMGQRFDAPAEALLAVVVRDSWRETGVVQSVVPSISLADYVEVCPYANGLPDIQMKPEGIELAAAHHDGLYIEQPLTTIGDVMVLTTVLNFLGVQGAVVGAGDFPGQLNERLVMKHSGNVELPLLSTMTGMMNMSHVKQAVLWRTHGPGTAWWFLRNGISVLDLSPSPKMVAAAANLLSDNLKIVVSDRGGVNAGLLLSDLTGCRDIVYGDKDKSSGTKVSFAQSDLDSLAGSTVLLEDDRAVTLGTLQSVLTTMFAYGARRAVVMVTHAEMVGPAWERYRQIMQLGDVRFIVADTGIPMAPETRDCFDLVPVRGDMTGILELVRQGCDFWGEEGARLLAQKGYCLSGWQVYCRGNC